MNRINNEYDKFINSIAGTNNVDVIPHSTDTADVAAAMVAHARAHAKLIADEQAAADKVAVDKAASEQAAADQAAADQAVAAAEKAAADKIVAEKAAADKIVAEKAAADKVAADQAAADQAAADQAAADQAAADQAAAIQAVTETAPTVKASVDQVTNERAIDEQSVTAAIIAAAAASAAAHAIAPVSSTTAVQGAEKAAANDAIIAAATSAAYANATALQAATAATDSTAAEIEKSAMASVIPTVNAESAVCTTQLVAACKAYYENMRPNVAEITTDASYADEKQAQLLCGKHALNNLFRTTWSCSNIDDPYTTADLDTIKNENTSNSVENYNKYLKALHTSRPIKLHKLCQLHNVFSGDNQECKEGDAYDMEVLVNALHIAGYNTTHAGIEIINRPTAVDTVLEILKTKPAGLILRTVSDADSGHFIAIRKQLDDDTEYEAIDTLYTDSIDKTNNTRIYKITADADAMKIWLNGAIYKHISNILVVHNFDGKYIPYNPAESSSDDTNMIFTDVDGKVYAYKYDNARKMIDITDIICNQCKQDAKSQFEIADLYKCIQDFSDAVGVDGIEINNFKGYIPIYENDLNKIIKDIQGAAEEQPKTDTSIPEAVEEQPKTDTSIQIEAAELPGAVMPAPTIPPVLPVTDKRITNGLLLLISHILKHKNDVQPVGQASTATANDGTESAQTKIVKPSIKFDNVKYNDAVEKFKKNINREFADANSIEISPVTIDIDPEGNDKYILFGSFTAGDVKITRYNTHYDLSIDTKIPGSVKQVPVNIDVVQTPSPVPVIADAPTATRIVQTPSPVPVIADAPTTTQIVQTPSPAPVIATEPQPNNSATIAAAANAVTNTSTPASQPNNDNYSAAIAAAVAAIAAR